jgi:multiple sugar transport system permease protein
VSVTAQSITPPRSIDRARETTVTRQTPSGRFRSSDVPLYVALTLLAIIFSLPFFWLTMTSLKPPAEVFSEEWVPSEFTLKNYRDLFRQSAVERWLWNSLQIAVLGVVTVVLSSALTAYGFARLRFRGRNALFALVMATYMIPGAVTMVPTFLIWNELGLVGTTVPLWAGNLFGSAFYIFMLRQFLLSIPQDLMDAARVDGASYLRIFWSIMLPLIKPAIAAVAVFEFQAKWNDFINPLIYLHSTSQYTMSLGLGTFKTEFETQWSLIMAASVVLTLPMILLFFVAQRYFIEGVASTGLKG